MPDVEEAMTLVRLRGGQELEHWPLVDLQHEILVVATANHDRGSLDPGNEVDGIDFRERYLVDVQAADTEHGHLRALVQGQEHDSHPAAHAVAEKAQFLLIEVVPLLQVVERAEKILGDLEVKFGSIGPAADIVKRKLQAPPGTAALVGFFVERPEHGPPAPDQKGDDSGRLLARKCSLHERIGAR